MFDMSLQDIRDKSPCREGWAKLLASLGGCAVPMTTRVTLGQIAKSNGAPDAWWSVRAMDWSDLAVRRKVVGVLMLAVKRASKATEDQRVTDCIAAVDAWVAGDDTIDLRVAADAAYAAADAAYAAADADAAAYAAYAAADTAYAAAYAAYAAADADAAYAKEEAAQASDLIEAFGG